MDYTSNVFECLQCGSCCLGRGGVRFNEEEAAEAAFYLKTDLPEFKRLYFKGDGPPWEINVDLEGYCLFHQPDGRCLVYPAKPQVCHLWPFLPGILKEESAFEDARTACPGINENISWEEFKAAWDGEKGEQKY